MLLSSLNREQMEACETMEGPLLVLAGAGSGKTRVVTHRIVHLMESGVSPSKILGLTFTNKAAREMKERILKMTSSHVVISTFHSLGARILRESIEHLGYKTDFTIYDEEDVEKTLKECMKNLPSYEKKLELRTFRSLISKAKNGMCDPSSAKAEGTTEEDVLFPTVYRRYQKMLQDSNALDFDDLLFLTVRLFQEHAAVLDMYRERWQYLLIDEYQDTNEAQYRMVTRLAGKSCNVCAVGDPDQSIYSWRGANIRNILDFERDFPGAKIIRLEQNYRSRTNILNAANEVIENNSGRLKKSLWSDRGPGEKIAQFTADTEQEEARFVVDRIRHHVDNEKLSLSQIAVFYRTNAQSRALEDRFLFARIPYVIVGGISFYQRREIKDILAYLRVVQSDADRVSFLRALNLPKRGIGQATLDKIFAVQEESGVPIFSFVEAVVRGEVSSLRLTAKQGAGLEEFVRLIGELRTLTSMKDLVQAAIDKSGYLQVLRADPETFAERKDNLDELISKAVEWEEEHEGVEEKLALFLEELSLKSTLDEADASEERVSLMTVHNGKGLEFPVVFLVGLEEDLFPHANSRGSSAALEEERRLFYVGMTRAKERLYLTHAHLRYLWGTARSQRPSRFLMEVPSRYVERVKRSPLKI